MTSDYNTYIESLTKREIEVLRLLETGASNQEIADALVVEVSTVKWYNSQIYDKLQVKNRKQAIIRARTLGILEINMSDPILRIQHNLPADMFPFIGRKQEIQELVQYLSDEAFRLITILGIGGMGKTRLSIEIGRRLISYFRDGVYFIPLSPVTSTEQIITTLAEVIGFKFHSDNQPRQQLLEHLNHQQVLLIMDNFEHLLDSAELLTDILQGAPKIKMLVTSREKLNLAGEVVHLLNGLSLPPAIVIQVSSDYDAVTLFMASAQRINVRIDNREISVVVRICQLLGGMPLAILLAAAWLDTLSLIEIEAEIHTGLGILEANLRDEPARHHSIQATFDTSWKRLSTQEQSIFMRLSVFRDGFTREAAQKVTGASIRDLQRLVHTSFIQLTSSGRYVVHELMRQYGEQKLKSSGEFKTIQDEHAQYFAEFITPLGDTSWGMASREMLQEVNADYDNVRAAWLFQVEQKNITELRRFLDGMWMFFDQYSRSLEGIILFEPLLNIFHDTSDDIKLFRGQILARVAWFHSDTGHHQKAFEFAQQSLQIVQTYSSTSDILFLYLLLYIISVFMEKRHEAWDYGEKGLELAQKIDASKWLVPFRGRMCLSYFWVGDYEEALRWTEALPEYKWRAVMMCGIFVHLGKYDQAEEHLLFAINHYHNHRIEHLQGYSSLIAWSIQAGNIEKAWSYVQRGLQYADDGAYAWGTFDILTVTMQLLIAEKKYRPATELLALILQHPANIESNRVLTSTHQDTLEANLSIDEFDAAWARGKQLDLGEVITDYMER